MWKSCVEMVWDPIYFLLRFPLRFLAVGNNHCDALRAEILEEIKCGNYGLTLQKLDHALFPPKISSMISCVSNKNYPGPNIINSQILQFLINKKMENGFMKMSQSDDCLDD